MVARRTPPAWLAAPIAALLGVGWAWGASAVEDPGPRAALITRAHAIVLGAGRAAHGLSVCVGLAAAGLSIASLLCARQLREAGSDPALAPLRGRVRRWMAVGLGAFGLALGALGAYEPRRPSGGAGSWALSAAVCAVAIAAMGFAAATRPAPERRAEAARGFGGVAWLGLLAGGLSTAWAPLHAIAALGSFGQTRDLPLTSWFAATNGLRPGEAFVGTLPFVLATLAVALLLVSVRGALGAIVAVAPFALATVFGLLGVRATATRAFGSVIDLPLRLGRPVAWTYLPDDLGSLEACGPMVEADLVAFHEERVTIGGVDVGPLPFGDVDCRALAWKLVERAHAVRSGGDGAYDRLGFLSVVPDAPASAVGCVVSALERIAFEARRERARLAPETVPVGAEDADFGSSTFMGTRASAPQFVWVGSDAASGLRCQAQPLVDPGEPRCPSCNPEMRVEVQASQEKFVVVGKVSRTVVSVVDVARGGDPRAHCGYAALGARLASEWASYGSHRAVDDPVRDVGVARIGPGMMWADVMGVAAALGCVERPGAGPRPDGPRAFDVWILGGR